MATRTFGCFEESFGITYKKKLEQYLNSDNYKANWKMCMSLYWCFQKAHYRKGEITEQTRLSINLSGASITTGLRVTSNGTLFTLELFLFRLSPQVLEVSHLLLSSAKCLSIEQLSREKDLAQVPICQLWTIHLQLVKLFRVCTNFHWTSLTTLHEQDEATLKYLHSPVF